ncbi:MAG TPA: T9SS type A sorting domain-containing protein [Bacteroidales bacterium]|nr:T9SS type A sorting domain-containing protein [Bacteroidales bacterium]
MKVSTSGLVLKAIGIIEENVPLFLSFWDPAPTFMVYPFAYQNTHETYGQMVIEDNELNVLTKSWITTEADAWGTITTPQGTYNNVFRLKITSLDSTIMSMGGGPVFESGYETVDYAWYSAAHRMPVFEINGDFEDGEYSAWQVSYLVSETVGIAEKPADNFKVYPNPASSHVNIDLPASEGSVVLKLIDMSGKLIHQNVISQNQDKHHFDVSSFPKGVYMMQIIKNNETISSRKIIVR